MMKALRYELRFTTPAFLGDAEQNGRWRTPPFKAQLRQWWRVAYAADSNFRLDVEQMRREEGLLFGNAWLSHREGNREVADHRKSLVQTRLSRWETGGQNSWEGLEQGTVDHPEVQKTNYKVGPQAYLGFGPLDARGGTKLAKSNAAIQAGESARIAIAFPSAHDDAALDMLLRANAPRIERALHLMHLYGSVGGRSRNGWGSYVMEPIEGSPPWPAASDALTPRPWRDALALDWAHAIGSDERGALIWTTGALPDWRTVMRRLAEVKIGLRTQKEPFEFFVDQAVGDREIRDRDGQRRGIEHAAPQPRHWLSYPVTNHSVKPWGNNARLPNTLRFKVRPTSDGKLVGVIFHVPHLPPAAFQPDRNAIEGVWKQVHVQLDATPGLARSKE
jgi:CRISPR-associated protein Cmr1